MRLGLASQYFCDHTIGRLNLGLVQHLSRDQFEVVLIGGRHGHDHVGRVFRASADQFVELPNDVARARQTIVDCDLDILLFADIGMDPLTYTLSFSRMAPLQCVTWGHPVTTGSPVMDYFVSSELLELSDADQHYTEQLVRLPNLAVCCQRPRLAEHPRDRESFGFCATDHLYVCPQTLFKLHPEFDKLLAAILHSDPAGKLVLIEGKYAYWQQHLKQRFARTPPAVMDRIVFLPRLRRADFLALCRVADVLLDTLHFGGGHTSYEGLGLGTPVVALPSPYLRGKITRALYQMMGVNDLVVNTHQQYVETAVLLATNDDFAAAVRTRIDESSDVLFDDIRGVRQLEQFLVEAAESNR